MSLRVLSDMIDDYLAIEEQGRQAQKAFKTARKERVQNVKEMGLATALAEAFGKFPVSEGDRRQLDTLLDRYADHLDEEITARIERMLHR